MDGEDYFWLLLYLSPTILFFTILHAIKEKSEGYDLCKRMYRFKNIISVLAILALLTSLALCVVLSNVLLILFLVEVAAGAAACIAYLTTKAWIMDVSKKERWLRIMVVIAILYYLPIGLAIRSGPVLAIINLVVAVVFFVSIFKIKPVEQWKEMSVYLCDHNLFRRMYHSEYCGLLGSTKTNTSLMDAMARGYTPCPLCDPPPGPSNLDTKIRILESLIITDGDRKDLCEVLSTIGPPVNRVDRSREFHAQKIHKRPVPITNRRQWNANYHIEVIASLPGFAEDKELDRWMSAGAAYYDAGDYGKALQYLNWALERMPALEPYIFYYMRICQRVLSIPLTVAESKYEAQSLHERSLVRCKWCGRYTRYINPNVGTYGFMPERNSCLFCGRSYPMPSWMWDSPDGRAYSYYRHSFIDKEFYDEFEEDYQTAGS